MAFIDKAFNAEHTAIIANANRIIRDYQAQGFTLTLRQLYYQFVARALMGNNQKNYKRLGGILNDARMAGLIDWSAIEDRTRNLRRSATWTSPETIIVADQFRMDKWLGQKMRPEVWVEKDALIGVIEPACTEWQVAYFACRGNVSQSEQYVAGKRIAARLKDDKQGTLVIHLGDHDPSGIDMTRDNEDRLATFIGTKRGWRLIRIALNMDQIEELKPPPNPAKTTDSRYAGYAEKYGDESWELDALEPTYIDRIVREAIETGLDRSKWDREVEREAGMRDDLKKAADNWGDVTEFLERM